MFSLLLKLRDLFSAIKAKDVDAIIAALESIATLEGFDAYAQTAKAALAAIRAGDWSLLTAIVGTFLTNDIAPLLPTGTPAPMAALPGDLDALCDRGIALCDDAHKVSATPGQKVAFGPIIIGLFELAIQLLPKLIDLIRERRPSGPAIAENPAA